MAAYRVAISRSPTTIVAASVGCRSTTRLIPYGRSLSQPRSCPVLITDGDPDQDGEHIHLSGAMDAAEVYATTEDGVPPLLQIPDLFSSALPVIAALMAQINQRQAALILTAGWQPAKNAVSYEAQVSYDAGASWIGAFEGDRTTFEAVVGGSDQMKVRARGVTPAGARGAWSVVDVAAPSLVIGAGTVVMEPIDYAGLTEDVRSRLDRVLAVQAYVEEVSARALADFQAADARAQAAAVAAAAALDKAVEGIRNGEEIQNDLIEERTARITADGAFILTLDAAITRIGDAEAAIITERETRIADGVVFARDIDGLRVEVGDVVTSVSTERQARINADGALAGEISLVRVATEEAAAAIVEERRIQFEGNAFQGTQISALQLEVFDPDNPTGLPKARAAIVNERTARIAADSAQVETINGLSLRVGSAEGTIIEQARIQSEGNAFQATQIEAINVFLYDPENGLGVAHGKIFEERNARISADSAQLQSIDALLLRMGSAEGAIIEERRIQFEGNAFQGSQIEAINIALYDPQGGLGAAHGLIFEERNARVSADSSIVQQVNGVQARTNAGTASGRMTLSARSDISGVSARFEMLLAAETGGQTRGTGMTFDLLPNGSSQVRFDADKFVITSPGASGVPAFSFDAGTGTLSVPTCG